jgi:hypothetical protein
MTQNVTAVDGGREYLKARWRANEVVAESPPDKRDRFHNAGLPFLAVYLVDALNDVMTDDERRELVAQILAESRDGVWAWGPAAGVDVDTTSAAMRALYRLGHRHPLHVLDRFYNPKTGLYLTFHDPGFVNSDLGLQLPPQALVKHRGSHPCVLAQVYLLLQEQRALPELRDDIVDRIQQPDGSWASYCYPSPYYSTRFFSALLADRVADHPALMPRLERTSTFLLDEPGELTPTQAAERGESLAHLGSLVPQHASRIDDALAHIEEYLVATQNPDGSWPGELLWHFLDEDHTWVAGVDSKRIRSTALAVSLLQRRG